MSFRKTVIVFAVSLVATAWMFEAIGFNDAVGVSATEALMAIPAEIAGPILFVVAVLFLVNPSRNPSGR